MRLTLESLAGTHLAPLRLVGVGLELAPEERARWLSHVTVYRAALARHALDLVGASWNGALAVLERTEEGRAGLAARARARSLAGYGRHKSAALAAILGRHRDDRTLVFTQDNASAHAIAREHLVAPLTCEVSRAERRELLAAFADGSVRALVSSRVLNEGLDVPGASVGVVVGSTRRTGEHVQRVGRLLRPAPGKSAVVDDRFTIGTSEAAAASARRREVAP
jgi:superfamily II DNA or RNA helicase